MCPAPATLRALVLTPACPALALVLVACSAARPEGTSGTTEQRDPAPPAPTGATTARAATEPPAAMPEVILSPSGKAPVHVRVKLARTPAQRQRGLMFVQHMPLDEGMLFVFDEEQVQSFWMKNTVIALDLIFIRGDLTVAGVVEKAEPLTLEHRSVDAPSRYVLEVNGGFARANGITAGTRVELPPL